MSASRVVSPSIVALLLLLGGCATRPVNPPLTQVDPNSGYTFQTRQKHFKSQEDLVILAFAGGGTRAAAFSCWRDLTTCQVAVECDYSATDSKGRAPKIQKVGCAMVPRAG